LKIEYVQSPSFLTVFLYCIQVSELLFVTHDHWGIICKIKKLAKDGKNLLFFIKIFFQFFLFDSMFFQPFTLYSSQVYGQHLELLRGRERGARRAADGGDVLQPVRICLLLRTQTEPLSFSKAGHQREFAVSPVAYLCGNLYINPAHE